MSWLRKLFARVVGAFNPAVHERDLDGEIQGHLQRLFDHYRQRGLGPAAALAAARRDFGAIEPMKETYRDQRGLPWLDDLRHDVRHAIRALLRHRSFTIFAALTLSIGIGATTAIYSVVDQILLRPLPFRDSERLVRVVENFTGAVPGRVFQRGVTYEELAEWRARSRTLSDAAALIPLGQRMVLTTEGTAGLWGAMASSEVFDLLGVRAMIGRTLDAGDDRNPGVVVLDFNTWQRHFGADPRVLGSTIEMRAGSNEPHFQPRLLTVVGVLPADFEFPTRRLDFFIPMTLDASRPAPPRVTMLARLNPGVSLDAAIDEANIIGTAVAVPRSADAPQLPGPRFEVLQLKDQLVGHLRPALGVFLVAAGVVLLIVCANVANLMLARNTARRRELVIRLAIGASRGRLVRHILAECALLASIGGLGGAVVGAAGVLIVKQLATVDAPGILRLVFGSTVLPRAAEVGVDLRILGVSIGLAAVTSVIFGLLPALHASGASQLASLGLRGGGKDHRATRIRGALVVGQLVMATILLVGAALLARSFIKLTTIDKGYDSSNVLTFQLMFPAQHPITRKAEMIDMLLTRLRARPDVHAAGFARHGILITEELMIGTFMPPGKALEPATGERRRPRVRSVSPGFLTAMGVRVLDGREFQITDSPHTRPAIVINQSMAREYFGTQSPVGQVVDWRGGQEGVQVTVLGVVDDVRQESLSAERYPEVFVDYRQLLSLGQTWNEPAAALNEWAIGFLSFAVRTGGDPSSVVPAVRQIVRGVDASIGIDSIVPMDQMVANALTRERFYAVIAGAFAAIAALLAAIGIYGVLAYAVAQRTQEIGVRMTVGARRITILGLVLRHGLGLAGLGIVIGLVAAAALTRYLQALLFEITPLDAVTFFGVSILLAAVAALAMFVPAYRATAVNPVIALRAE